MSKKRCMPLLALILGLGVGFCQPVQAFSLTGAVSGVANKLKPIVGFFTNFVSMMVTSLKNTDYNDQMIVMYGQTASGDSSTPPYSLAYDFGFRGGGDIEQPFGFTFDAMGRYRYQPMTAMLLPGVIPDITDPTGQRKKPLSLGDGIAPELIKGLLGIVVGGRSNAEKIWAPVGYFLKVSPETQFLLKAIILLNSARKNTSLSRGLKGKYPTLMDVPYELMMLIFRLVITPDIEETMKLNPGFGLDKSYRWEKIVTLSRPSKLLAKMPKFFVELLNNFKPSVDSTEIQEYKDRFAAPISDMMQYYSDVRSQRPYEVRIRYAQDNVLDRIDIKTFNQSDVTLLEYMVQQIISERYRGLKTFISSMDSVSTAVVDEEGVSDTSAASGATDNLLLLSVDVTRMTDFIGRRVPKIKDFLAYLLSPGKKDLWSPGLTGYLTAISKSIDLEFADLKKMAADLTDARKALVEAKQREGSAFTLDHPAQVLEQRVSQLIIDKLDAITAQEAGSLGTLSGNKVPVPLPAYLDIKFWEAMRVMRQAFKGDKQYLVNDSQLSVSKALVQAYAICFRANMDLLYLEDLIKTDSRSFVVKTNTGQTLTATGIELYKSFMDAERYLLYCRNKASVYRSSLGKMSAQQLLQDPQMAALQKDLDNASILYSRARSAFRYQLRQFEFDRRIPRAKKVGKVMLGDSSMNGLGDVNVISVSQEQSAQASQAAASSKPATTEATSLASDTQQSTDSGSQSTETTAPQQDATPKEDDPFAVFDTQASTSVSSGAGEEEVLSDVSVTSETTEKPIFDNDPPTNTSTTQTAQEGFLGMTPQQYDYPRSVNMFLRQEFARLLLRCPRFQEYANAQMDQMVFQMSGMHINELLQAASGDASDIGLEDEKAFLPENDFFSQKVSLDEVGTLGSAEDMDALGKELADKYGIDTGDDYSGPAVEEYSMDSEGAETGSSSAWDSEDSADATSSASNTASSQAPLSQEPIEGVSDAFASMGDEFADINMSAQDQAALAQEAAGVDVSDPWVVTSTDPFAGGFDDDSSQSGVAQGTSFSAEPQDQSYDPFAQADQLVDMNQ